MTIAIAAIAAGFALAWWSQRRRADRLEQDVERERKVAAAIAVQRDAALQELREVARGMSDGMKPRITFNRRLFGQRNR